MDASAKAIPTRRDVNAHSLHAQYADLNQEREAASLGMWVFLVTEVMFFGGMITGYTAYRFAYPEAFQAGSVHMVFWAGTANTAILITASLFVALAVHAAKTGRRKVLVVCLLLAMVLGLSFLGIKGYEYWDHWVQHKVPGRTFEWSGADPYHAQMFFVMYFFLTGFHALHMIIGITALVILTYFAHNGRYTPEYHNPIENLALYWHFVDIVWIFLYPMLYLIGHKHV